MIKKLSLVALLFCLVPLAIQGVFSIISNISAPLAVSAQPHLQKTAPGNPGVYLVTYADGDDVFFQNQQFLAYSALNKGIDFILNYQRSHIDATFAEKHAKILQQKRGAGYWLWKPWIILKTLETTPENAIIFYVDSGFFLCSSIQPLIELAQANDMVFIAYNDPKEFGYLGIKTKHEVFSRLNCDTLLCRQASMVLGGFMVLRNTQTTRSFIQKWLSHCCDEALLTDTPSTQPEYPEYKNHLHDQAILSVLCYLNPQGHYLFPEKELRHYAIWHHRHPDRAAESLLPCTQSRGFFRDLQKKILNNRLMT